MNDSLHHVEKPEADPATSPIDQWPRLDELQRELAALNNSLRREAQLTYLAALLLLGLMTAWFWYACVRLLPRLEPAALVANGAGLIEERIVLARQRLESQVEQQAPALAEHLSRQALAAIPACRQALEAYIVAQSERSLLQVVDTSEEQFDPVLDKNRAQVASVVEQLKRNDDVSAATLSALEAIVQQELGAEMKTNAGEVLETLNRLTERFQRLAAGRGLNEQERRERLALMMIRRLQLQAAEQWNSTLP